MALMLGSVKFQAFDSNGDPLSGGKVYTYSPGTTTNKATYPTVADAIAATNANANPVILDSRGEANIVLAGKTKILLKDSADATIYTVDNVEGDAASDVMDDNGNPILKFSTTASAVNSITISNAATANAPTISVTGSDSNIGLTEKVKGTGAFKVTDDSNAAALIVQPTASAVNSITITSAATANAPTISVTGSDSNIGLTEQVKGTGAFKVTDDSNAAALIVQPTASAVNQVTITNQVTTVAPVISATGTDTNIDLSIAPKGTGVVKIPGTATAPATIRLYEDTDNGTNYVGLAAAASIAANLTYELPSAAPSTNGQVLASTTAGVMSWSDAGASQCMSVTLSGTQSVSNATYTKITFDSETFDTAGTFASNKWTPNVAGKYLITLTCEFAAQADQAYQIAAIYRNGSVVSRTIGQSSGTAEQGVHNSSVITMNGTTDYIEGYAFHSRGSSTNLSTSTRMTGAYVGT